jgi:hypothetical protein
LFVENTIQTTDYFGKYLHGGRIARYRQTKVFATLAQNEPSKKIGLGVVRL